MAKKRRLRAKNRMGIVVPYDIAAEDVTMANGNNLEQELQNMGDDQLMKQNIKTVQANVQRLYDKLANMAFLNVADKAAAAPTDLDWNVPKKVLSIANNIEHAVVMYNGDPVSSVSVDAGDTIDLLIAGAPGYEVTSVTASGATAINNGNGTFTLRVKVNNDMTLEIRGYTEEVPVEVTVGITTSNAAGALGLSNTSVQQGDTFVGQVTYLNDDYNSFEISSVKDTSNNDVPYTVNGDTITIENVPSDITITAIAKYQLKVWFGKSLNIFGGMKDVEGECVTDYIKMTGLTTTQATWNNGGLSKLGAFPLMNDSRCMLLYDSDKRLIYIDGEYEILRVSSYLSTSDGNPRNVKSAWLTGIINAAGAKTPLYARFTAKCSGTTINSAASFLQGGVEFFEKSNYVASTDYPTQHSLSYTLNNAQVDNAQHPTTFQHGQPLEIAFAGSTSSYSINNATIVVTMGGNTLTAGTDYTITSKTKSGTTWKVIRIENATGDINFNVSIA